MGKVLFISNCDPMGIGGGSFATHAYVKAFSEALGGNSYILLPEEGSKDIDETIPVSKYIRVKRRNVLQKALSLITGDVQRYTNAVKKIVRNNQEDFTYAVCNSCMSSGALVDFLHSRNIRVITVHHNFEREYFKDNPTVSCFKSLYAHHIAELERKAYTRSDCNIFLTKEDQNRFETFYGKVDGRNVTLGVFEFKDIPPLPKQVKDKSVKPLTFVITGQLCLEQGIDSVIYFLDELYQYIPKDSKIIIAGRSPAPIIEERCKNLPNISLVPNPQNMQDIIQQGDIYICPTRVGGGLKLRIMDGLRLGLPVITHVCSARGYDMFADSDYFQVFRNQQEFAESVNFAVELYKNNKIDKETIYSEYQKSFSYQAGMERIKKIVDTIN